MRLYSKNEPDRRFIDCRSVYDNILKSDAAPKPLRESATAMMNLLMRIEQELELKGDWFGETSQKPTWDGFVGDLTLRLRRSATSESPPLVGITPDGDGLIYGKVENFPLEDRGFFDVDFRVPDSEAVWPEARVRMRALSVSKGLAAITIALQQCG